MDKLRNWDILSIATWNKSKFPQNTIMKQFRKVAGEIGEWKEARTRQHRLEELADIYIASAGLTRFGTLGTIGSFICFLMQIIDGMGMETGTLKYAVNVKMRENVEREFDEQMQHISGAAQR